MGSTRTIAASRARRTMRSVTARQSFGRVGVGHAADGGEAARRRRARARRDVLLVLVARLAQVHVQIDEAGRHDLARAVDDLGAVRARARLDGFHHAVLDQQVRDFVEIRGGVDDPPALQEECRRHAECVPTIAALGKGYSTRTTAVPSARTRSSQALRTASASLPSIVTFTL